MIGATSGTSKAGIRKFTEVTLLSRGFAILLLLNSGLIAGSHGSGSSPLFSRALNKAIASMERTSSERSHDTSSNTDPDIYFSIRGEVLSWKDGQEGLGGVKVFLVNEERSAEALSKKSVQSQYTISDYTCNYTCGSTCGTTCGSTCGSTCAGNYTCDYTCDGPTCGSTCSGDYTCVGTNTCGGGYTCSGTHTCNNTATCDGTPTCGLQTCDVTCDGTPTCSGDNTCSGSTCGSTCGITCGSTCGSTCNTTCGSECPDTSSLHHTLTDSLGRYEFVQVPEGTYRLAAEADGYRFEADTVHLGMLDNFSVFDTAADTTALYDTVTRLDTVFYDSIMKIETIQDTVSVFVTPADTQVRLSETRVSNLNFVASNPVRKGECPLRRSRNSPSFSIRHEQSTIVISFTLPMQSNVSLRIYDAAGNVVDRLFSGWKPKGRHRVSWIPAPERSSVRYFVVLKAGGGTFAREVPSHPAH